MLEGYYAITLKRIFHFLKESYKEQVLKPQS